ncbi:MAG: hypothetical protein LBC96_01175 [Lachnospiraceae bacterium]|nr:hypothetical protein [Lachnospiraceae bacterium]
MDGDVYKETLKTEVLHEYGTAISAAFYRYANENNIDLDDKNNPIASAEHEAFILADKLYGATAEQVAEFEKRLDEIKAYLYEVIPDAVI